MAQLAIKNLSKLALAFSKIVTNAIAGHNSYHETKNYIVWKFINVPKDLVRSFIVTFSSGKN